MKVYRLLVYEGPEEWVLSTLNSPNAFVKGSAPVGTLEEGKSIREWFLSGKFGPDADLNGVLPKGVIR